MFRRSQLRYTIIEQNTFVDRFFHSSLELADFGKTDGRDTSTLFSFLNNLHSLQDRFHGQFHSNTSQHPEFKLLQILKNYHHHVDDIDEFRIYNARNEFTLSHSEMIIILSYTAVKAVLNAKKRPNTEKGIQSISEFIDGFEYISTNDSFFSERCPIINKGKTYYPGFNIYKCVYDIINIIADICRKTSELPQEKCIINLGGTYISKNNIEKHNLLCHTGEVPLLTTEGCITP